MEATANVPIWAMAVIAGGSALFGAIVGGAMAGVLELWRQVVNGLTAARVIRLEFIENATLVDMALEREGPEVSFREHAWLELRTAIAPVLNETVLTLLGAVYASIPQAQVYADRLAAMDSDSGSESNLKTWRKRLFVSATNLLEVEAAGRHALFWRVVRPRAMTAPSFEEAERWADRVEEAEREAEQAGDAAILERQRGLHR